VLRPPIAEAILALPECQNLTECLIVLVNRNLRFDFRGGT